MNLSKLEKLIDMRNEALEKIAKFQPSTIIQIPDVQETFDLGYQKGIEDYMRIKDLKSCGHDGTASKCEMCQEYNIITERLKRNNIDLE